MNNKIIATDNGQLFRCPKFDSGWCYASLEITNSNDDNGECNNPQSCEHRQEMFLKQIKESNYVK